MSDRPRPAWHALALRGAPLVAIAAVLVWHAQQFDFVTDDAYISFVFTRNLVERGELVFNPGAPVEGYTNFLWTVLLALPLAVGIAPEIASRVLGIGFALATLVVVFRTTERMIGQRWAYLPPLLLALASGFACWSSGGLETQLFTFLVALALDDHLAAAVRPRRLARLGVVLALAAMTRPEGLLVAGLIGLHRLAVNVVQERRLRPSADELLGAATFLALWAPWFAWRWWYYGWPLPNTYYVKAAGAPVGADYDEKLHAAGLYYVQQWAQQLRLVWGAPLLVAGLVPTRRPEGRERWRWVSLAAPLALVYLVYAVSVGGDFMGLHRFIMPVFVIVAVVVALGLERLTGLVPAGRGRVMIGAAVAAAVVVGFGVAQARLTRASLHPPRGKLAERGIDTPGYLIAYTENRAAIGRAMAGCFRDDDFSIVGGAGAQPYFARMRGVDVFGLVSDRIAHEVRPNNPRPGHNKWGPDALLAGYDPDFVFSCYAIHSAAQAGPLRCGGFWKARGFEEVTLQIPGLDGKREGRDDAPGGPVADRYTFLVRKDRQFACRDLRR